jgi:hypothetical protein
MGYRLPTVYEILGNGGHGGLRVQMLIKGSMPEGWFWTSTADSRDSGREMIVDIQSNSYREYDKTSSEISVICVRQ